MSIPTDCIFVIASFIDPKDIESLHELMMWNEDTRVDTRWHALFADTWVCFKRDWTCKEFNVNFAPISKVCVPSRMFAGRNDFKFIEMIPKHVREIKIVLPMKWLQFSDANINKVDERVTFIHTIIDCVNAFVPTVEKGLESWNRGRNIDKSLASDYFKGIGYQLKHLTVNAATARFGSADINALRYMPNLESLEGNSGIIMSAKSLKNLKTLKILNSNSWNVYAPVLYRTGGQAPKLLTFELFPLLEHLWLGDGNYQNIEQITECQKLKTFYMRCNNGFSMDHVLKLMIDLLPDLEHVCMAEIPFVPSNIEDTKIPGVTVITDLRPSMISKAIHRSYRLEYRRPDYKKAVPTEIQPIREETIQKVDTIQNEGTESERKKRKTE